MSPEPRIFLDEGRAFVRIARTHTARAGIRARAIVVINNIKNWLKSNTESHGRIQKENYVKFPFSKILNLM